MTDFEASYSGALVSIVVPAYNAEAVICKALNSLIDQEVEKWEAIVIDDGSVDSTGSLVQTFVERDDRIRMLSQANEGVSSARNRAMECARAPYIAFLDADDWLPKHFLADVVDGLITSGADILACNFANNGRGDCFGFGQFQGDGVAFLRKALQSKSVTFPCWMFVVSRDLVRRSGVGFSEDRAYGEDQEFIMKLLLLANRVVSLPANKAVYGYTSARVGSAMGSASDRQFDFVDAMREVLSFAETLSSKQSAYDWGDVLSMLSDRAFDALCFSTETAMCNGMRLRRASALVTDRIEGLPSHEYKARYLPYKVFMMLWPRFKMPALIFLKFQGVLVGFVRRCRAERTHVSA